MHQNMPFQGTKLIFFSGERKATLRQWKGENPSLRRLDPRAFGCLYSGIALIMQSVIRRVLLVCKNHSYAHCRCTMEK